MDFLSWYRKFFSELSNSSTSPQPVAGRMLFLGAVVDADEFYLFHQTLEEVITEESIKSKKFPWDNQGIVKRSLNSGQRLWMVKTPGVPLAVADQKLWLIEGTGNKFRIIALHTENGKILHISDWFEMLLGFPAMFNHHHRQGLSVWVNTRWDSSITQLWIRIDGQTRYAGGVQVSEATEAAHQSMISLMVKVICATGEISLVETRHIQGNRLKPEKEPPIPFPSNCLEEIPFPLSRISNAGHHVLRSVKLSNHVVSLEILPFRKFLPRLLFLRVFSSDALVHCGVS
jgi:hypothetical protein